MSILVTSPGKHIYFFLPSDVCNREGLGVVSNGLSLLESASKVQLRLFTVNQPVRHSLAFFENRAEISWDSSTILDKTSYFLIYTYILY